MITSWLFLQIGKIQPQKYLSLSGSVSSLKREGGGGGEIGNGTLTSRLDPTAFSVMSGKHT